MFRKYGIVLGIGLSYFIGIFSVFHLRPSFLDIAIGLQMNITLAFTLGLGFFIYKNKAIELSVSSLTWVFLALLILIQPFLNSITYPDALIFPIIYCLILALVTIIIKQVIVNEEKGREFLCNSIAIILLFGGLFTKVILWLQLFSINVPFIADLGSNQPIGNIVQPNQTAFVICLAMVASLYLNEILTWYKKINFIILFGFAIGIAFTASRGGLLIMLGIPFLYALILNMPTKLRAIQWGISSIILAIGYGVGLYLFNQFVVGTSENALVRAMGAAGLASNNERILEQNLAYNLFSSHPISGYGWGNSLKGAFDYALQDNWFILAHHSHVFITQIAAELGLLGLLIFIPLSWILSKNFNFKMNAIQAFPVALVVVTLVYSMSEFPLWYLRFSLIFAIALSMIDPSALKMKAYYNSLLGSICIIISLTSIYYYKAYLEYNRYTELTFSDQLTTQQVNKLKDVFGYREYKEQLLYYSLTLDNHLLSQKISLGNRVITKIPAMVFLEKQAVYYALNNEDNKSLELYKKGCIIDYRKNCSLIEKNLKDNAKNNAENFGEIYSHFMIWKNSK